MKTLFYKIRAGRYELAEFRDNGGDEAKFIFEFPCDARLSLGGRIFPVKCGMLTLRVSELREGEIYPILYLDGTAHSLEGFAVGGGVILPLPHGEEYIRRLSGLCEELSQRVAALEKETKAINERISAPLKF